MQDLGMHTKHVQVTQRWLPDSSRTNKRLCAEQVQRSHRVFQCRQLQEFQFLTFLSKCRVLLSYHLSQKDLRWIDRRKKYFCHENLLCTHVCAI